MPPQSCMDAQVRCVHQSFEGSRPPTKTFSRFEINVRAGGDFLVRGIAHYGPSFFAHCESEAVLLHRLPQWLDEMRSEAALGRPESMEEGAARRAAQSPFVTE